MKRILFLIFTTLCIYSCTPSGYTLNGSVDNKALNGTKIYLKERINREWISLDSAIIENGKFSFKGVRDTAKIAYLVYTFPADNKVRQAFILENGKLTVSIDTTGFMNFGGTAQNDLLQSYQNEKNAFYKKTETFFKTHKDSAMTAEQQLALVKQQKEFDSEEFGIDRKFAVKHVNTIAGTFAFTNSFYGWTTAEKEAIIGLFNADTKSIPRIREIIADTETEKKVAAGKQYTDFRLPGLKGDSISLSDLVGKTDYVLVDFWASWCGSCIQSLPELKKLYAEYKGPRLEILGVSLDDNYEAWSSAVASHQLNWRHASDLKGWKCGGSRIYAVNSIPNTVLIDKNGKITGRNLSITEIANLLSKKAH